MAVRTIVRTTARIIALAATVPVTSGIVRRRVEIVLITAPAVTVPNTVGRVAIVRITTDRVLPGTARVTTVLVTTVAAGIARASIVQILNVLGTIGAVGIARTESPSISRSAANRSARNRLENRSVDRAGEIAPIPSRPATAHTISLIRSLSLNRSGSHLENRSVDLAAEIGRIGNRKASVRKGTVRAMVVRKAIVRVTGVRREIVRVTAGRRVTGPKAIVLHSTNSAPRAAEDLVVLAVESPAALAAAAVPVAAGSSRAASPPTVAINFG